MRSELTFRRPKPEIPWKLIGIGSGLFAFLIIVALIANALGGEDSSSNGAENIPSPAPSQVAPTDASKPSPTPSQTAPTEASTPSVEPKPAAPVVTAITVDELLDKINSAQLGGIKVGDQFRLTGELVTSEFWMTGATGEFSVLLKAKGGAQDLPVFVDESDAAGWQDGTKVRMIVEMGEATINGETTDGWIRAISVETIP